MSRIPKINTQDIEDYSAKKSFEELLDFLRQESPFLGFRLFEVVFDVAKTSYKLPHSLGFQPKDILQLSLTGSGLVTYNYSSFTSSNFDLTATGPCTVRFLAGTSTGAK